MLIGWLLNGKFDWIYGNGVIIFIDGIKNYLIFENILGWFIRLISFVSLLIVLC